MELHKVKSWVESDYMPLLSIMLATRKMFLRGEIPQIKNIEEGDIKETQEYILKKINGNNDKKRIFFLTGVLEQEKH